MGSYNLEDLINYFPKQYKNILTFFL